MKNLNLTNSNSNNVNINAITHTGVFHADEVMATAILLKVMEVNLMRTFKVPEEIPEDVIIYDIGGGKFDHHQRGGNGKRENGVPYSSAGLIWKEFGLQIVEDSANPKLVWQLVDRDLIQGIDAADNGVLPRLDYPTQGMSLYQVISGFNPTWDSEENKDNAFMRAVEFASTVLDNTLATAYSKVLAEEIVEAGIEAAEGQIMVLDRFVPWQDFIFSSASSKADEILFVVFPALRGGFNCQCVPDTLGGFGQRKPLPVAWRGLPVRDLQDVSGVDTAIFCHPGGFMCSAQTQEDAIKMANLAIEA